MKRFSTTGPKASRIAAAQNHTALIGEQLSAPIQKDDFTDVQRIQVYAIRPDPQQARRLGITLEMLRKPETVTDPKLREKIEHITGLSLSLVEPGQEMPIVVYRDGSNFRLVSGERRWWAAQLAGLETLVAKVLSERPDDLRLKQYVENAVRVDFTPGETLEALRGVIRESGELGKAIKSAADLQRRLGTPYSSVHRWWSILNGPQDVIDALVEHELPIRVAGEIARIEDPERRAEAIRLALSDGAAAQVAAKSGKPAAKRSGAPARLSFGGTANLEVGRAVLRRLRGSEPSTRELKDVESLTKAIRTEIEKIESELKGAAAR